MRRTVSGGLIIGDWGASRLRLWRIENGTAAERRDGPGILAAADPAAVLAAALRDWPVQRIVLCGMAGARDGLHETGYVRCPAGAKDWSEGAAAFHLHGIPVRIAPGVAFRDPRGCPDVMRGEETQLFGAMTLDRALGIGEHRVVLPGTHSKWVTIENGRIVRFRSFVTGELYAFLGQSSLLSDGTAGAADEDEDGFAAGLARSSGGDALTSDLFEARAARLTDGRSMEWAQGFVSGLLIGAELREMAPSGRVMVIGEAALSALYAEALAPVCDEIECRDGDECVIAGLRVLDGDD